MGRDQSVHFDGFRVSPGLNKTDAYEILEDCETSRWGRLRLGRREDHVRMKRALFEMRHWECEDLSELGCTG